MTPPAYCSKSATALVLAFMALAEGNAAELFPSGSVKVTDGKTSWNLKIIDHSMAETVDDRVKYIVFSFHTEQFPSRYVAAHTKGVYEAFQVLAPHFPVFAFVPVVVRNEQQPQAVVDGQVRQNDSGPTKGTVYDYIKTLKTPVSELPEFFQQFYAICLQSVTNGLVRIDKSTQIAPVFPVVTRQAPILESIIEDFGSPLEAPRFIITGTNGTIVRIIKKTGPDGLSEIRQVLPTLK